MMSENERNVARRSQYDMGVNTVPQSVLSDPRMELISPNSQVPLYVETRLEPPSFTRWRDPFPMPDPQVRVMNQEMRRLTDEMDRLWRESARYTHQPAPALDLRPFNLEYPRPFNPEYARPFNPEFLSVLPHIGGAAHAENWRMKENFHLDNPVVRGQDGRHQFRLEFDLRQFKPEEIVVSTEGRQLTVQARHEETTQGKRARREYFRQCTIPDNVDPLNLVSRHTHSGILSVYAPLPAHGDARMIPIKQK